MLQRKICEFCSKPYQGLDRQKFCCYSCAAKAVRKPQNTPTHTPSEASCPKCATVFWHGARSKERLRKYCSKKCADAARADALREARRLQAPRPKREPKIIPKICPLCGEPFTTTSRNARKTYCSIRCGSKGSQSGNRVVIPPEIIEELILKHGTFSNAARNSKFTYHSLRRRAAEFGIKQRPAEPKLRSDGYWGYTQSKNHRRIMERHLGRSLKSHQGVHHIDGNKMNNETENLVVTEGVSDHSKMHGSLEKCAFELFGKGLILFDRPTRRYVLPV